MKSDNRWEVSIISLKDENEIVYKVTRRYPSMSVAETKVFTDKESAKKQFEDWLDD